LQEKKETASEGLQIQPVLDGQARKRVTAKTSEVDRAGIMSSCGGRGNWCVKNVSNPLSWRDPQLQVKEAIGRSREGKGNETSNTNGENSNQKTRSLREVRVQEPTALEIKEVQKDGAVSTRNSGLVRRRVRKKFCPARKGTRPSAGRYWPSHLRGGRQ